MEQLTMNFIAHSGNRVSRHLVVEFLSQLLLRHREPRVLQVRQMTYLHSWLDGITTIFGSCSLMLMIGVSSPDLHLQLESRLNDHPCRQPGSMLEGEFAEVLEQLVPLVPDHLLHRLFLQSRAQLQESRETTPTKRLACIRSVASQRRGGETTLCFVELGRALHGTWDIKQEFENM